MTERHDTVVIGGGQAGLATGYYLRQHKQDFVILDAGERIGDPWRNRWDSLRVHTPARYTRLPGMAFPAAPEYFPRKDEVAEYLETYADQFELPVDLGVRVDRLGRNGERYQLITDDRRIEAANVVVAMGSYQVPKVPDFADEIDENTVQLHSSEYRNPDQLDEGGVLVVGAGNSGAEIALDVVESHETWLSGRDVGHVPFHIDSWFGRHLGVPFVMRVLFHRILTTGTPVGRRLRTKVMSRGGPLVRPNPADLDAAGIERVGRTTETWDGQPVVGDDEVLDVANVIWCTGFRPDFSWIDIPVFAGRDHPKEPVHDRGVVPDAPGLYFVGLFFLHAMTSSLFAGVGRDAKHVVDHLTSRERASRPAHVDDRSPSVTSA